jgi:hypothetical protein
MSVQLKLGAAASSPHACSRVCHNILNCLAEFEGRGRAPKPMRGDDFDLNAKTPDLRTGPKSKSLVVLSL